MRRLALLASVVIIAVSLLPHVAYSAMSQNTIDPNSLLSDNGRHITVTGPIVCTAGERLTVSVTVTQASTGAVAHGHTQEVCTGSLQRWTIKAVARGPVRFADGHADASALGTTRLNGTITDVRQWQAANGLTLTQVD